MKNDIILDEQQKEKSMETKILQHITKEDKLYFNMSKNKQNENLYYNKKNINEFMSGKFRFVNNNTIPIYNENIEKEIIDISKYTDEEFKKIAENNLNEHSKLQKGVVYKFNNIYIDFYSAIIKIFLKQSSSLFIKIDNFISYLKTPLDKKTVYYIYNKENKEYPLMDLTRYIVREKKFTKKEIEKGGFLEVQLDKKHKFFYEFLEDVPFYVSNLENFKLELLKTKQEVISKFSKNLIDRYVKETYGRSDDIIADAWKVINYLLILNIKNIPTEIQDKIKQLKFDVKKINTIIDRFLSITNEKENVKNEIEKIFKESPDYKRFK